MREYGKPELTCYERADLGYYSAANQSAQCQADCIAGNCTEVRTCAVTPCDTCDSDNSCGVGVIPETDCIEFGGC